jgi:hypothetical protein
MSAVGTIASSLPSERANGAAAARTLILSDPEDVRLERSQIGELIAALARAPDLDLVLVSSRAVEELVYLLHELGADADVIAENGACTAVRSPTLARRLGATETIRRRGRYWYIARAGSPVSGVLDAVERARGTRGETVRLATEVPAPRRAELVGGSHLIRLALARRCSVLVEPPADGAPDDAWLLALRREGYRVAPGAGWWVVWRGPDRAEAARTYLAARRSSGRRPSEVAAVGDAARDAKLLAAASTRFVAPRPDGSYDTQLLATLGAVPLAAGHAGLLEYLSSP